MNNLNKNIRAFLLKFIIVGILVGLFLQSLVISLLEKLRIPGLDETLADNYYLKLGLLILLSLLVYVLFILVSKIKFVSYRLIWLYYTYILDFKQKIIKKFNLQDRSENFYLDELILKSKAYNYKNFKDKQPLFIRRKDLSKKEYWKDWAYSIVLLFNNNVLLEKENMDKEQRFSLNINLENEFYGIYNNRGKKFLKEEFLTNEKKKLLKEKSTSINNFIFDHSISKNKLDLPLRPIRWASGGVLPIVNWKKKNWVILFFRGIDPVGWNVANGSSEEENEYIDLNDLIYREFSEEMLVLDSKPGSEHQVKQKLFFLENLPDHLDYTEILNRKHSKISRKLRLEQDKINIVYDHEKNKKGISTLKTPFFVNIKYINRKARLCTKKIRNVIFSVNPLEFGIEVIRLIRFDMSDNDVIFDGEIMEFGPSLPRRPIMLLSVDFLKKYYAKHKSLGQTIFDTESLECKRMDKITKDDFYIFDDDIDLAKKRYKEFPGSGNAEEFERLEYWETNFSSLFKDINNKDITDLDSNPLLSLCPVTWKTLETALHFKLI